MAQANHIPLDTLAIEREARRLRAVAFAELVRNAAAWVAARFGRRPQVTRAA